MVKTVETPENAMKTITSDKQIDKGIDFLGFFTSSPADAITSNPMKPKNPIAAPLTTPKIPYGMKPPFPKPSGTSSFGTDQFEVSSLKHPQMMT